jgi:ABC-type sugar transport system ATPase subunit
MSDDLMRRLRPELRGSEVVFGIRPEFVHLSKEQGEGGVVAEVYSRQNFGSSVLYHLKARAMDIRAVVPVNQHFEIGTDVSVSADWAQSMWFDAETKSLILGPNAQA